MNVVYIALLTKIIIAEKIRNSNINEKLEKKREHV